MKIRNGFVSNSSSSSFVIDIHNLTSITKEQLDKILEYPNTPGRMFSFKVRKNEIIGTTTGDNSHMDRYLKEVVGIHENLIVWEYN
ncbi:MAG: hypothetical protein ACXAC5_04210 [Promethearchaeota archaeon]|jgi:hypothetical protein